MPTKGPPPPVTLLSLEASIQLHWLGRVPVLTLFIDGREVTSTTLPKVSFWSRRRDAVPGAQKMARLWSAAVRRHLTRTLPSIVGGKLL